MCQLNSKPENLENPMEQYTSTLHNISEKTIPKTSMNPKELKKPRRKKLARFKTKTTQYHPDKF